MEEGSLRCDTNISLRRPGASALGAKVEIKNLNSFRAVKLALEFEAVRQAQGLDSGGRIEQQTRLWNAKTETSELMRTKEGAADYRYFPEPDLVPFVLDASLIERVRQGLPELPAQRARRLQQAHGLSAYDAFVLTQDRALADLFEAAVQAHPAPKAIANWLMGEVLAYLNARGLSLEAIKLRPEWLAHLVQLVDAGTLSGTMAKDVAVQMLEQGADPADLVTQQGLQQIVDAGTLEQVADDVLAANPKSVEDYGKGKANPQQLGEILARKLQALRTSSG
jgi:aspartyl-tRNA(Asn)/glutamyl-tRNA(Gln) amidotransferase subunit B